MLLSAEADPHLNTFPDRNPETIHEITLFDKVFSGDTKKTIFLNSTNS